MMNNTSRNREKRNSFKKNGTKKILLERLIKQDYNEHINLLAEREGFEPPDP